MAFPINNLMQIFVLASWREPVLPSRILFTPTKGADLMAGESANSTAEQYFSGQPGEEAGDASLNAQRFGVRETGISQLAESDAGPSQSADNIQRFDNAHTTASASSSQPASATQSTTMSQPASTDAPQRSEPDSVPSQPPTTASYSPPMVLGSLVFQSPQMHDLVTQAQQYAQSSATVLLCGESGTGKELFARLIHDSSPRCHERFVRVNCAALSESLLESELFGHERGAFTGALERRIGRFEWAHGGTILLDEVSEIPVQLQAKLLRVLEENELQRVGSNLDQEIDVRVIATSNRDLGREVAEGNFREDLFHRLNVLQLSLPSLRSRPADIGLLAKQFVRQFANESSTPLRGISANALKKLETYSWPGNVRQLRNAIHRACVVARGSMVFPEDLHLIDEQASTVPAWLLEKTLDEVEKLVILANLDRFKGNKTSAASHLGVSARTLSNKMKIYKQQGAA